MQTLTQILGVSKFDNEKKQDGRQEMLIAETVRMGKNVDFNKPVDICHKCGEPTQTDIEIMGKMRRVPVNCKCERDNYRQRKEDEKRRQTEHKLNRFKTYSLMDGNFEASTFENWKFKGDNEKIYEIGIQYCKNWEIVKKNNRWLLIRGRAGNGKTYLSFAIANELYKKGVTVLAISVGHILTMIQDSFNNHKSIGEIQILNTLNEAGLLILDDLGVESRTKWAYEKLYAIIDGRYRSKKPVIITTNLDESELRENLMTVDFKTRLIDKRERIYNRLAEVCTVLEVGGSSWRILKGEKNKDMLLKEIGVRI